MEIVLHAIGESTVLNSSRRIIIYAVVLVVNPDAAKEYSTADDYAYLKEDKKDE